MVKPGNPDEHLAKAAEFLRAVQAMRAAALPARQAAAAYYAAFHVAQALLGTAGLAAETHAGVQTLLARHFVKDGPLPPTTARDLGHLLTDRLLADYGVNEEMTGPAAAESVAAAAGIIRPMLDAVAARAPDLAGAVGQVRAALEA